MPESAKIINVAAFPLWTLTLIGLAGIVAFFGAILRVLTPTLRRQYPVIGVPVLIFLLVNALGTGDRRGWLWFYGLVGVALAIPLWWMGPMPPDMPSARDPAIYAHPQYPVVARRGRIAGLGMLVLAAVALVLSAIFVTGV